MGEKGLDYNDEALYYNDEALYQILCLPSTQC